MKTANPGLQAVEYLFVAISMVGIAISTFTQEVTYAAIPLIITLLLNIFNRQQVEENLLLLEEKLLKKQQEVNKTDEELPSVHSSDDVKTLEAKIEDTKGTISQLQQDFQQLSSSYDLNESKEFKSQLNDFQTTLANWQNHFDVLNSVDINALQQEIINLQSRLDSFSQVQAEIAQIKDNSTNLEGSLQDYKNEINNLFNLIQSLPPRSELEDLKQQLDSLIPLKNELNNLVNWESFNSMSSQLNNLLAQFNERKEPENIETLTNQVNKVSQSLSNLDFNQFGEQIQNLREQLEAIPQKDLLETLGNQRNELQNLQQKIEELEHQPHITPVTKKRILKSKPRRVRVNQRRR